MSFGDLKRDEVDQLNELKYEIFLGDFFVLIIQLRDDSNCCMKLTWVININLQYLFLRQSSRYAYTFLKCCAESEIQTGLSA